MTIFLVKEFLLSLVAKGQGQDKEETDTRKQDLQKNRARLLWFLDYPLLIPWSVASTWSKCGLGGYVDLLHPESSSNPLATIY